MATNAAEMELINNISSAAARENFDKWWNEERAVEINERWTIKRKFLDAKGEDPSLLSKYVLIDVLANVGDHKKVVELLDEQIEKKGHTKQDIIWVSIKGCNYVSTESVCKNITNYVNIEKLCLGEAIEADDASAVAEMVANPSMASLRMLDLANNKFETAGVEILLSALVKNQNIIDLDLSNCSIGGGGGKPIATYIASNPTTQRLLLNGNKLGIYGTKDLANGLATNTTLTTLGLFFNNAGEEGIEAVLEMLRSSSISTDQCVNKEEYSALSELEAIVKESSEIDQLEQIKENVGSAKNTTLLQVEVGDNKASPSQLSELDKILDRNNASAREKEVEELKMKELKRIEEEVRKNKEEEDAKERKMQKEHKPPPIKKLDSAAPPAAIRKGAKAPKETPKTKDIKVALKQKPPPEPRSPQKTRDVKPVPPVKKPPGGALPALR